MAIQWRSWMRFLGGGLWNPDVGQQQSGANYGYGNDALQTISEERALQISTANRCIRIIAETAAALPMAGFQQLPNGDRAMLQTSHWLESLINEPNETMSGDEWRETQFAQMAGWGNAYSMAVPNAAGRTTELWPYKVANMQVRRAVDRTLEYSYPNQWGVPQTLDTKRVLHLRTFTLDGVTGLSPLGLARQSLGLAVGAERYASSFYAQGGRPAGILTSDKILTDKQRSQIRNEFGGLADAKGQKPGEKKNGEGGPEDQVGKRLWVLEGNLKYQVITVTPEDMQMLETRSFQVADIARFFGVPLFLLMENSKDTSWGTGLEQMNLGFLGYTLRAYLRRMIVTWNRCVIPAPDRGKLFVDIDVSPLLAMDATAQKELYGGFASNAIMTRNEIRRILKLPMSTEKNADKLTAQTALAPIETLGRIPTPAAPTGIGASA